MLKKNLALLAQYGIDGFILCLVLAIVLAYMQPVLGASIISVPLHYATTYGVSLTFLLYGLRLSMQQLKEGVRNWKLHLLIQATTFIFFPLLILAIKPFFAGTINQELWLAIFYLAALPSTVSSSVVMVSLAGGNIVAAIFNATLSSLLGIIITPLWMSLFLESTNGDFDLQEVFLKLILQVIVPVTIGVFLHRFWGAWAQKNKNYLKLLDQTVIILIVYQSFCESFYQRIFETLPLASIFLLAVSMIVLFQAIYQLIKWVAQWMQFSEPEISTAIFCGSKKSLVHGTVMSKVLFPANTAVGIYLLPLMIYHAGQLIGASYLARKRRIRLEEESKKHP